LNGKLGDLGIAISFKPNSFLPENNFLKSRFGTPNFSEPSLKNFDYSSDIYSIGAAIYWIWKNEPISKIQDNVDFEKLKDDDLGKIIYKCTCQKELRYKGLREVYEDISSFCLKDSKGNWKRSFFLFFIFIFALFGIFYFSIKNNKSNESIVNNKLKVQNVREQKDLKKEEILNLSKDEKEAILRLAIIKIGEKKYEDALKLLEKIYREDPYSEIYAWWYGRVLMDPYVGKIDEAKKVVSDYLAKNPKSEKLQTLLEVLKNLK